MDVKITKVVGLIGNAHGDADREQDVVVMYDNNTYGIETALYNYTPEYAEYIDSDRYMQDDECYAWDEWDLCYDGNNITIERPGYAPYEFEVANVPQVNVRGYNDIDRACDLSNYNIAKITDTEYQVNWTEE